MLGRTIPRAHSQRLTEHIVILFRQVDEPLPNIRVQPVEVVFRRLIRYGRFFYFVKNESHYLLRYPGRAVASPPFASRIGDSTPFVLNRVELFQFAG